MRGPSPRLGPFVVGKRLGPFVVGKVQSTAVPGPIDAARAGSRPSTTKPAAADQVVGPASSSGTIRRPLMRSGWMAIQLSLG
jgi:hypothetical protein